ncbi:hypothetical protein Lal_00047794 [Lupinus albus]|uniref:Putative transcription factor interactor and regulator CCHC(Zn) family n=1 Tax=Lupinus albus TaxID=3870 RepID=A0A6A5N7M7_LUPAL|nr:putative transcription factor interactor and regulator CCHC(Zn) family [Lupinus albus]KAF1879122.1 hypothetical protein Lal_00047794 [Lupinus albus]
MDVVELCDRKRCREENPQDIANEKKKKRKKRRKEKNNPNNTGAESQNPSKPIEQEATTTEARKKRKNKQVQIKTESVETPAQGLTLTKIPFKWATQTSLGKSNVPRKTHGVKLTGSPVKDASVICRACRQRGHRFEICQRLKYLSRDEQICFFCGEIGHSLGKCSLSTAGGGRFANCLFCYAQGHFSINCPRNGYRINPKVAAASGPINKTVENEGMPVAEVRNM